MSTGVAPEAVLEQVLGVVAADHATADVGGDEALVPVGDVQAADDVPGVGVQVRVAAGEEVGAGLAEEVLHSVGDEPGGGDGEAEAEPADVQLPQLALPDEGARGAPRHGVAGDEDQADDGDDDDGDAHGEGDEKPGGHGLVLREGESVGFGQRPVDVYICMPGGAG